jgi:hypothetical protein
MGWEGESPMPDKQRLHQLIDQLPVSEIAAALRFLEFLLSQEAPVDPEMLARIDEPRAHPSAGVPHEAVMREFRFVKQFVWEPAAPADLRRMDRETAHAHPACMDALRRDRRR